MARVARGRSGSLDHKCNLVCTCLRGLLIDIINAAK